MQKQLVAEISVLDRVMYLLEEKSVRHIAEHDHGFHEFISQLYEEVNHKAVALSTLA